MRRVLGDATQQETWRGLVAAGWMDSCPHGASTKSAHDFGRHEAVRPNSNASDPERTLAALGTPPMRGGGTF